MWHTALFFHFTIKAYFPGSAESYLLFFLEKSWLHCYDMLIRKKQFILHLKRMHNNSLKSFIVHFPTILSTLVKYQIPSVHTVGRVVYTRQGFTLSHRRLKEGNKVLLRMSSRNHLPLSLLLVDSQLSQVMVNGVCTCSQSSPSHHCQLLLFHSWARASS